MKFEPSIEVTVGNISPAFARELAQTWTQKTEEAKALVYNTVRSMDAAGIARVAQAIDGFYGAKNGPVQLRVFLSEFLATCPPVEDEDDESTLAP